MNEVKTNKEINVAQLAVELGRVPLRVVGPNDDGETVIRSADVSTEQLQAAIRAHESNSNWVDPNPPSDSPQVIEARELATTRERLRNLRTKGWANLSAAEKTEVSQRVLDLLGR